jgi:hypothetical protein
MIIRRDITNQEKLKNFYVQEKKKNEKSIVEKTASKFSTVDRVVLAKSSIRPSFS